MGKRIFYYEHESKTGWLRVLIIALLVLGLLAAGIFYGTQREMTSCFDAMQHAESILSPEESVWQSDVCNILVLGVDGRADVSGSRSDSNIVLSINKTTKKISVISFLRDIYLTIPGYGNSRLGHAYAYGGGALTAQTLQENFGIKISGYVVFDLLTASHVVDALGGSKVSINYEEANYINSYAWELNEVSGHPYEDSYAYLPAAYLQPDWQGDSLTLNGIQAISYARIRYVGGNGDYGRAERQQKVIWGILENLIDVKNIKSALDELPGACSGIVTSFSTSQLQDIEKTVIKCMASGIIEQGSVGGWKEVYCNNVSIPVDNTWNYATIDEMSVLEVNFAANQEILSQMIGQQKE